MDTRVVVNACRWVLQPSGEIRSGVGVEARRDDARLRAEVDGNEVP